MKPLIILLFFLVSFSTFCQNKKKDSISVAKEAAAAKRKYIANYHKGVYNVYQIDSIPAKGIIIDRGWKYQLADNFAWAKNDFDDSKWDTVAIDKPFKDFSMLGERKIAWFRKKIKVDSSMVNQPYILSVFIKGAAEIYLDGKLLHKIGKVSNNPAKEVTENIVEKHPYSISFDKSGEHLLAIRYSAAQYQSFFDNLEIYPLSIKLRKLNGFNEDVIKDIYNQQLVSGIIIGIFLMMAFIHFFFYKFFDNQRYNLLFCISMLLFGVHILLTHEISNIDDLSVYLYLRQILKLTFPLLHVILLIAVYEYLQQPKKTLFWLAIGFFVVINFLIIFDVLKGGVYNFTIYSLLIINYIFLIRQSIKQKKQEGNALKKAGLLFLIILAVAFALFVIFAIVFTAILKQNELNEYLLIFVSIFLILFMVGPQFCVSAATSFTLAKQYVKTSNSLKEKLIEVEMLSNEKQQILATQNLLLENQVKERTLDLEKSLNDLKSTQQQLIQSEKLASLGELTAGIAHEIQNPLNFVNNFSELSSELIDEMNEEIEKQETEEVKAIASDLKMNLQKINHHGKRASSIVKGMLEHSRASTGVKELTDINALADEYLRLAYHGLRAKNNAFNSDFKTDFDENLPKIAVNPQDFSRVLLNLFNNAFYAVNVARISNSCVIIKTETIDNQIIIKIKDNGIGMNEATKAKIFQPFFTTKPTGQGTGLGLSLAYDIVTKGHGGTLECQTKEGEGTTFIIKLPV